MTEKWTAEKLLVFESLARWIDRSLADIAAVLKYTPGYQLVGRFPKYGVVAR